MNIYSLAVCLSEIVWFYVYVYIMYMHTDCICISVCCMHGISCSLDHCEPSWLMHLRSCVERDVHPCEERDVHPCGYQSAASSATSRWDLAHTVVLPTQCEFDVTEGPHDFPELCCQVQGIRSPGLQLALTLGWFCAAPLPDLGSLSLSLSLSSESL